MAEYFSDKFLKKTGKAVINKNITQEDLDNWINE